MRKKWAIACLSVLCAIAMAFGIMTTTAIKVDANEVDSTILSAETLNAGATSGNPWKKTFDYWSNATSVTYKQSGVEIEGTNTANAFNIINGPMSITDGSAFEMRLTIPAYTNGAQDTAVVRNQVITLFNAGSEIGASVTIWGNGYGANRTITAEFAIGSDKVTGVKISKRIMETGGNGVKIGFTAEEGWFAEVYDSSTGTFPYVSVKPEGWSASVSAKEITRVNMKRGDYDSSSTKTYVAIQELNGQNLCLDTNNQLEITNSFNASSLKVAENVTFTAGGTYNYELVGVNANDSTVNTATKTSDAEIWQMINTNLMGDIGWNSNGSKGDCTASGIYLTLKKDNEVVGEWSNKSSWGKSSQTAITFTVPNAGGNYTLEVKLLTGKGNVTVSTLDFEIEKETYELLTSATLSLEDLVYVNYYLTVNSSSGNKPVITNGKLLLWSVEPQAETVAEREILVQQSTNGNGDYVASTDGIAAKEIGDTMYAQFCVEIQGETLKTAVFAYSPKTYAMNKLNDESASDKLKDLCLALLDYASTAQTYFGYKTQELANKDVTEEMRASLAEYRAETYQKTGEYVAQSVSFGYGLQMTLNLDGKIAMNAYIFADNATKVEIATFDEKPTEEQINAKANAVELEKIDGKYKMNFEKKFSAKELGDSVWFVVYVTTEDGEMRSSAISYGASVYAYNKLRSATASEAVKALCQAMLDYASSAQIYFDYNVENLANALQ